MRALSFLPPRDPPLHLRRDRDRRTAISQPVDCRVAASFLTLVLSPFDVDPPCQMQTLFPFPPFSTFFVAMSHALVASIREQSIFRGYFRPEL